MAVNPATQTEVTPEMVQAGEDALEHYYLGDGRYALQE
jgi:hypothetical protein